MLPRITISLAALGLSLAGAVGSAHALDFGHARMLSGVGQPLRADMAIVQLTPQELDTVQVRVAPAAAWIEAGLTPPVELASLRVQMLPGLAPDARLLRITSDQVFDGDVADLLIDVSTPAGALRHQVSLVPQRRTIRLAAGAAASAVTRAGADAIAVRRGDTLLALAEQYAAPGFSVYQMMAALWAENADAFIDGNMNLVKAGATLRRPDRATLSRLTDRQARQLFVAHAQALAARRGRAGAMLAPAPGAVAAAPAMAAAAPLATSAPDAAAEPPQDQLRLRGVGVDAQGARPDTPAAESDAQTSTRAAMQDSSARIAQLEQNVQDLQQVLRARGGDAAAASAHGTVTGTIEPARADADTRADAAPTSGGAAEVAPQPDSAPGAAPPTPALPAPSSQAPPNQAPSSSAPVAPAVQDAPGAVTPLWPWLAAVLALLAALVAGLRRRTRAVHAGAGTITDAMIEDKLKTINLNLDEDDAAPAATSKPGDATRPS